jgi:hypothetical protein
MWLPGTLATTNGVGAGSVNFLSRLLRHFFCGQTQRRFAPSVQRAQKSKNLHFHSENTAHRAGGGVEKNSLDRLRPGSWPDSQRRNARGNSRDDAREIDRVAVAGGIDLPEGATDTPPTVPRSF